MRRALILAALLLVGCDRLEETTPTERMVQSEQTAADEAPLRQRVTFTKGSATDELAVLKQRVDLQQESIDHLTRSVDNLARAECAQLKINDQLLGTHEADKPAVKAAC